jgi:hypothetical protein
MVVEATSTGEGRRVPIEVRLQRSDGSWLITTYEVTGKPAEDIAGRTGSDQDNPEHVSADDAQAAVAIVHEYYRAISSRDFERAYRYWGVSGPPGQSLQSFAAGFTDTASVQAKTGAPSRIEPAAGSRYIEVPTTIVATTKAGTARRFEGTYTLRRTVIDGAPAAERRWHIYRASIRQVTDPPAALR